MSLSGQIGTKLQFWVREVFSKTEQFGKWVWKLSLGCFVCLFGCCCCCFSVLRRFNKHMSLDREEDVFWKCKEDGRMILGIKLYNYVNCWSDYVNCWSVLAAFYGMRLSPLSCRHSRPPARRPEFTVVLFLLRDPCEVLMWRYLFDTTSMPKNRIHSR